MDLRFLNSFVAVVDAGSIAEAARRLDMSPTTLAQQIRALEADLGSRLLLRVGRTARPTVAGSRVLERARQLLQDARDLRSAASATGLPAGPLRLGTTPTALTGLLPGVLRRWMKAHPGIEVYMEPGTSAALIRRVADGSLDAAIAVHPAFDLPKTCAWQPLRQEPLVLLAPASMPVECPLRTAAQQPFIRYDRQVVAGRMADDYLRANGIRPRMQFELDGIEQIAQLVAEGFGVSVLPDWPGPADPRLRRWPLPGAPMRSVGLLWLRSSVRSELAQEFARLAEPARAG